MVAAADEAFRVRVDAALASFAKAKRTELDTISPDLAAFADAAIVMKQSPG